VIDLAFGRDGTMYVLEIVKEGLLGVEVFGEPPIGALWAVDGGSKTELVPGTLMAPGGVAVGFNGSLSVTTGTVFGPGGGAVVRVNP
jgi:sugar lactone lactonase YvrE